MDVYLCDGCRGVWLDGETLMSICPTLAHLPDHREEIALTGAQGAGIALCLRCGAPPFEYEVLGVAIDFCTQCNGVWLDGDEYEEAMLGGAGPAADQTRGGPYRRAASVLAGGIKCAYCGTVTDPKNKSLLTLHEARSRDRYGLDAIRTAIQYIDNPQAQPPH